MPPIAIGIISIVQQVLTATNSASVQALVADVKTFFTQLFRGGIITVEQQNALHAWCDVTQEAVLKGVKPPQFAVEPDPEKAP